MIWYDYPQQHIRGYRTMQKMNLKEWIVIALVIVAVLAASFLILKSAGVVSKNTVDVDTLYSGYDLSLAMPGPEFAAEGEYLEINLNDEHMKAARSESALVSEGDKLAVINKWAAELYPCFGSFMLASAMDQLTFQTGEGILKNSTNTKKTANSIGLWAKNRLQHTQYVDFFQQFPGKDPWGAINAIQPAYKKVLPSEMLAMSAYTGRITGKCCSLAALNMGIFMVTGADPDDIVTLHFGSHEVGVIRYDEMLYITNNELVYPIDDAVKGFLMDQQYKGFYSYRLSMVLNFKLTEAFFSSDGALLERITALTGTSGNLPSTPLLTAGDMQDRASLHARVFGQTDDEEQNRLFTLARYAYQSLYVNEPALYLKASARAPVVTELAKKLKSEQEIVRWIKANIAYAPIFDDYAQRLMIADQVVVFKKGTPKDQAVLAWSLLKLNGIGSVIKITERKAYLETGGTLYDAGTWEPTGGIQGNVLLELKLE